MLAQDKDEEELVLFLELRRREKCHQASLLLIGSDINTMSSQPHRRTAADNFLYAENEKSDYDWLVSPPDSPTNQHDAPGALKPLLWNCLEEERNNVSSENKTMSFRPSSSSSSRSTSTSTPTRRPSSSSGTSRGTLTSTRATLTSSGPSKLARRPSSSGTSRSTVTAARATSTVSSTNSSRSTSRASTPIRRPSSSSGTSRVTLTAARATTASNGKQTNRPMTAPNSKPGFRSSTPTRRPSTPTGSSTELKSKPTRPAPQIIDSGTSTRSNNRPMTAPNSKPGSRSGTPTRRPPTPTGSSSTKLKTKPSKPVSSQILRSRPWEPYEMPGFSLEAPSNLRTTLPDRPQTASSSSSGITRAFGGASSRSSSRSASIERSVPSRQSLSPSRNRAPTGNNDNGGLSNPLAKGNQMVEKRVANMRKLAPPTEKGGRGGSGDLTAGKLRSGSDGSGSGRNLPQSSIDMALRHLDVKRGSITGNFRPSVTKVPATSLYSVRARTKRPVSSSESSESSVNILCLDGSDDNVSERSYS